jgi:hypothetical protein
MGYVLFTDQDTKYTVFKYKFRNAYTSREPEKNDYTSIE